MSSARKSGRLQPMIYGLEVWHGTVTATAVDERVPEASRAGGAAAEADHSRNRKMPGDMGKEVRQRPAT